MSGKAIFLRVFWFAVCIFFGASAFFGCEGEADRTLKIRAYAPYDQKSGVSRKSNTFDGFVSGPISKLHLGILDYNEATEEYFKVAPTQKLSNKNDPELIDLQSSVAPRIYMLEGFGNFKVQSATSDLGCGGCIANACECVFQDCANGVKVCTDSISGSVVARGISSPVAYDGHNAKTVNLMLALVNTFAYTTKSNGSQSRMKKRRLGHATVPLPLGNALIIGGKGEYSESYSGGTYVNSAELYTYGSQTFSSISVSGWPSDGLAFFSLIVFRSTSEYVEFALFGGETSVGMSDKIYICNYDIKNKSLSIEENNLPQGVNPTGRPSVVRLVNNNGIESDYILIIGGKDNNDDPSKQVWYYDFASMSGGLLEKENEVEPGAFIAGLEIARDLHTVTEMPGYIAVVVGGRNPDGTTVEEVEILTFDREDHTLSANVIKNSTVLTTSNRAGHIAVPVGLKSGTGEGGKPLARVFIYGGYRFETIGGDEKIEYFNFPDDGMLEVAYINPYGDNAEQYVQGKSWNVHNLYRQQRIGNEVAIDGEYPNRFPCVEAEWACLGGATEPVTILVAGGWRNGDTESLLASDGAEIIQLKSEGGVSRSELKLGSANEIKDKLSIQVPYVTSAMNNHRYGSSMVSLDNGMILVTGGAKSKDEGARAWSDAELFVPPTYNKWGNPEEVVPAYF